MTVDTRNALALHEAQRTVENFEHTYGLSTEEMLQCAEGDPRLAQIDGFELMDYSCLSRLRF